MCADTDIRYALNIIKKYEYKPEECTTEVISMLYLS